MLYLSHFPMLSRPSLPMLASCEQAPTLRTSFDAGHARAYFCKMLSTGHGPRTDKPKIVPNPDHITVEHLKNGELTFYVTKPVPPPRAERKTTSIKHRSAAVEGVNTTGGVSRVDQNAVDDMVQDAALLHHLAMLSGNWTYSTRLACRAAWQDAIDQKRKNGVASRDARIVYSRLTRSQAYRTLCLSWQDVRDDVHGNILPEIVERLSTGQKRRTVRKEMGLSKTTMRTCMMKLSAYFFQPTFAAEPGKRADKRADKQADPIYTRPARSTNDVPSPVKVEYTDEQWYSVYGSSAWTLTELTHGAGI